MGQPDHLACSGSPCVDDRPLPLTIRASSSPAPVTAHQKPPPRPPARVRKGLGHAPRRAGPPEWTAPPAISSNDERKTCHEQGIEGVLYYVYSDPPCGACGRCDGGTRSPPYAHPCDARCVFAVTVIRGCLSSLMQPGAGNDGGCATPGSAGRSRGAPLIGTARRQSCQPCPTRAQVLAMSHLGVPPCLWSRAASDAISANGPWL